MTTLVLLGHSHLLRLRSALHARDLPARADREGLRVLFHDVWVRRPDYADSAAGGGVLFNPDLLAQIRGLTADSSEVVFVTLFGGNGHVLFGLSRHPRPFDVVLPTQPDLPLEPDAEVVPVAYLTAAMHPHVVPYLWQMIALRQAVGERVLCLETPPPYGDDDYVRTHLGSYIPDAGNVVAAPLRFKLWRLHSGTVEAHCAAHGIEFVPVPPEGLDGAGFMAREGYGPDATHANAWFAEHVLRQIEARLGQPIVSFEEFS